MSENTALRPEGAGMEMNASLPLKRAINQTKLADGILSVNSHVDVKFRSIPGKLCEKSVFINIYHNVSYII